MKGMTLNRHILQQETKHPEMRGELSLLLSQMGFVAKILAREMRRAALVGQLGLVGDRNPTGDAQKKLDVFANETVVEAFTETGLMAAIASEELDEVKHISCGDDARYILCTDPATAADPKRMATFKGNLVNQICEASGGPCKYTGKSMKEAHKGMGVSTGDFNALVEDLVKALDKLKVGEKEKNEMLGILGPMKSDIVERP